MLSLPFVWSDDCLRHEPEAEIWVGARTAATEVPARALAIRQALLDDGAVEVPGVVEDDSGVLAGHDPARRDFLRTAWEDWSAAGLPSDRVVPYIFAREGLTSGPAPARPTAVWARPGLFAYDTMTLIGPGTWEAARAAVDVALTAADLVLGGAPAAYACCRPPGHHVTSSCYGGSGYLKHAPAPPAPGGGSGGSCYLNNAAAAAARLRAGLDGPVAVLDVDAHHGNGTQSV